MQGNEERAAEHTWNVCEQRSDEGNAADERVAKPSSFLGALLVNQRPVGAGVHARRRRAVRAEVALVGLLFRQVALDGAVGAGHHAGPAADTLLGVDPYHTFPVLLDGA